jgi:TnpA family transposase
MPRKAVLSAAQQAALIALPPSKEDLRLHYTLSENDLAIIRRRRGPHNRLGFAVQLCYLRFPGQAMTFEAEPPGELLTHVAQQVGVTPNAWTNMQRGTKRDANTRSNCKASLGTAVYDRRIPQGSRVVD